MPAEVGCAVSHNDLSGVCIVPTELLEAVNIMAEKLLPTIVICSSYPAKQLFYLLCSLTIENCQLHRNDVNREKDAVNRAHIFKRFQPTPPFSYFSPVNKKNCFISGGNQSKIFLPLLRLSQKNHRNERRWERGVGWGILPPPPTPSTLLNNCPIRT